MSADAAHDLADSETRPDRPGNLVGLVVGALAQPARMQRHGDEHVDLVTGPRQSVGQQPAERAAERPLAAVLEGENETVERRRVGERGADAVESPAGLGCGAAVSRLRQTAAPAGLSNER